jgi:hypothetical protein
MVGEVMSIFNYPAQKVFGIIIGRTPTMAVMDLMVGKNV